MILRFVGSMCSIATYSDLHSQIKVINNSWALPIISQQSSSSYNKYHARVATYI